MFRYSEALEKWLKIVYIMSDPSNKSSTSNNPKTRIDQKSRAPLNIIQIVLWKIHWKLTATLSRIHWNLSLFIWARQAPSLSLLLSLMSVWKIILRNPTKEKNLAKISIQDNWNLLKITILRNHSWGKHWGKIGKIPPLIRVKFIKVCSK